MIYLFWKSYNSHLPSSSKAFVCSKNILWFYFLRLKTPALCLLGLAEHALNSIVFQSLLHYRKPLVDLCVHCSLSLPCFQATVTSHHNYTTSCRNTGRIPQFHQLRNLFQSAADGFDRPSVAK